MYYFQLVLTFLLIVGMLKLGFDFLALGLKIIGTTVARKQAMQQSFSISFLFLLALFAIVFIWMDNSNTNLFEVFWMIVVTVWLSFLVSIFWALGVFAMYRK